MRTIATVLAVLLALSQTACAKATKKEKVLRKALSETRLRYDYAVDQNARYSRQLRKALDKRK